MGQGKSKSIIEHNYTQAINMILDSKLYHENKWHHTKEKNYVTFWKDNDTNVFATIISDHWPLTKPMLDLTLGHYYYYVCDSQHRYSYDITTDEWTAPPDSYLDKFITEWQKLIENAEESSKEPKTKNNEPEYLQEGGDDPVSYDIKLTDGKDTAITELAENIPDIKEDVMLIVGSEYSNSQEDDEIRTNINFTSSLSDVKNILSASWSRGKELLQTEADATSAMPRLSIRENKLVLSAKAPSRGFLLTIAHISDSNMNELKDFMDKEEINYTS
jgi:hypothetical protein